MSKYMDTPHYRVNKFVAAMRVCAPETKVISHLAGAFPLTVEDLDAVVRDSAALYTSGGLGLIADERERQICGEGWTPAHDDAHSGGELAEAAACYASLASEQSRDEDNPCTDRTPPNAWPWDAEWWKPKDRLRNLVRAGALIAAEIDRVQRAAAYPAAEIAEGRES